MNLGREGRGREGRLPKINMSGSSSSWQDRRFRAWRQSLVYARHHPLRAASCALRGFFFFLFFPPLGDPGKDERRILDLFTRPE